MYKPTYHTLSKRGYITLLALLVSIITFAQGITVKGIVIDETDIPLIGATVQVKGGQAGAATDLDGNFTLTVNKNATLVVSYIGYLTQEVKVQGKNQLTIKLVPDSKTLDEVVVVGYGTMKKSDLTGSVSSVSAKDVEGFQTSSIAGALGGQIAGVQITSTDGTPGARLHGGKNAGFFVRLWKRDHLRQLCTGGKKPQHRNLSGDGAGHLYGAQPAGSDSRKTSGSGKTSDHVVSLHEAFFPYFNC